MASASEIIENIENTFGNFSEFVYDQSMLIGSSPSSFNGQLYQGVIDIYRTLLPVAYKLLIIFVLIEFYNQTVKLELVDFKGFFKILLRAMTVRLLLDSGIYILSFIFEATATIQNTIVLSASSGGTGLDMVMIAEKVNELGFMDRMFLSTQLFTMSFIMTILKFIIFTQIISRMLMIYVYTALFPLGIVTLGSEPTSEGAKLYLKNYLAICLKGVGIVLVLVMYQILMQSNIMDTFSPSGEIQDALIYEMLMAVALIGMLWKLEKVMKNIAGLQF